MMEFDIKLSNPEKVHKFVQITSTCEHSIDLVYGRYMVDGKSIVGVFTLNLTQPVRMVIHGEECSEMIEQLRQNDYIVS